LAYQLCESYSFIKQNLIFVFWVQLSYRQTFLIRKIIGMAMYKLPNLSRWFTETVFESKSRKYLLRLIKCKSYPLPQEAKDALRIIVFEAHEDTRRHLRRLAGINLDPLQKMVTPDPAEGYPEKLDIQTLKGYFGEIIAGIVAVNYARFDETDWQMPVSFFRFHGPALDEIERLRQNPGATKKLPGRTGDDNLAFVRAKDGNIYKGLFCEAKCTASHDSGLIADAHEKLSQSNLLPVTLLQNLVAVLIDYDDAESIGWVDAIRKLWLSRGQGFERHDLVGYTCGQFPVQPSRISWINCNQPHPKYTGERYLEATEIHLPDIEQLILEVYGKCEVQNEPA
jgi:hypothetical protein